MKNLEQQAVQQYEADCKTKKTTPEPIGKMLVHTNRFGFGSIVQLFSKKMKALGQYHFKAEQTAKATPPPPVAKSTIAPSKVAASKIAPSKATVAVAPKTSKATAAVVSNVSKAKAVLNDGFSAEEKELVNNLFGDTSNQPEDAVYNTANGFTKEQAKIIKNL